MCVQARVTHRLQTVSTLGWESRNPPSTDPRSFLPHGVQPRGSKGPSQLCYLPYFNHRNGREGLSTCTHVLSLVHTISISAYLYTHTEQYNPSVCGNVIRHVMYRVYHLPSTTPVQLSKVTYAAGHTAHTYPVVVRLVGGDTLCCLRIMKNLRTVSKRGRIRTNDQPPTHLSTESVVFEPVPHDTPGTVQREGAGELDHPPSPPYPLPPSAHGHQPPGRGSCRRLAVVSVLDAPAPEPTPRSEGWPSWCRVGSTSQPSPLMLCRRPRGWMLSW